MIPNWYPEHPPIYDIEKTYSENLENGPFFDGKLFKEKKQASSIDFLGHKIHAPIGVAAGPLLNAKWVSLAAALGFDILTYKTIRSSAHPAHLMPNVIYVEKKDLHTARKIEAPEQDLSSLTITNSFGMPSQSPDYLLQDIEKANQSLGTGQILIVSVAGTPNQGMSFRENFIQTALFAKSAGAKIIEANFSCPNIDRMEGSLYMSPEAVYEYAKSIANAIKPIPLLLKVGLFKNLEQMKTVFKAAARAGVRGICGINSVSMQIVDAEGRPALGEDRKIAGVCGGAIRPLALHFIREAKEIVASEKLGLILLGCGGIMNSHHVDEFLQTGATAALSATGMMWDPYLAARYKERP